MAAGAGTACWPTCTCTASTRGIARRPSTSCSTPHSQRASARSPSPITTRSPAALEARARAVERGLPLHVIVGSEIKTASDGEIIGLFLHEEVPRGLTFAETLERIRAQGGLVYVPHPFDHFHTTPARVLLHEHAGAIDVVETANARLWLERDNRAAERFAQRARPAARGRIGRPRARRHRHGRAAPGAVRRPDVVPARGRRRRDRAPAAQHAAAAGREAPPPARETSAIDAVAAGDRRDRRAAVELRRGARRRALRALPGACDQRGKRTWR